MFFFHRHPLDEKGKEINTHCLDLDNNEFVDVDRRKTKKISKGLFFNENFEKLHKKDSFIERLDDYGRDYHTAKRFVMKRYQYGMFKSGCVLCMAQPHNSVFLEERPKYHKIVFSPLDNEFILMKIKEYNEEGFNKFSRGNLIEFLNGSWANIKSNRIVKYNKILGELDTQKIQRHVSENLILWRSRLKYNKLCTECIYTCKQPIKQNLVICRKFESE